MQARHLTILISTTSIVLSLSALGLRHAADVERRGGAADSGPGQRTPPHPGSRGGGVESASGRERLADSREARVERLGARLRGVLMNPGDLERMRGLGRLIDELQPDEYEPVMEALRRLRMTPNAYHEAAFMLLAGWAELDAPAAIRWECQWSERRGLGDNTANPTIAMGAWLRRNPQELEAWVKSLSDERMTHLLTFVRDEVERADERRKMLEQSRMEPAEAWAAIRELPEEQRRQRSKQLGLAMAKRGGMELFRKWLEVLPEAEQRQAIIGQLSASSMEGGSTQEKVALFRDHPEVAAEIDTGPLYGWWIRDDAGEAMEALAELPAENEEQSRQRDQVVTRVIDCLGHYPAQPERVVELMDRYPEAATDRAVAGWMRYIGNVAESNKPWEFYLAQLPRIGEERVRQAAGDYLLDEWRKADPEAADAWRRQQLPDQPVRGN